MITRERLEELIKERATIYILDFVGNVKEYQLGVSEVSDGIDYWLFTITGRLFEQKQDGEKAMKELKWALKYHATRTEELDLPMWEDWQRVNKTGLYAMSFRDKKYHYCELMVFHDEIKVTKQAYGLEVLFDEPNTEENYEKACDLCLKLFKGEENVD